MLVMHHYPLPLENLFQPIISTTPIFGSDTVSMEFPHSFLKCPLMGKLRSGVTKFSWLFSQAITKYALMTSECCSI